MSKGEFYEVPQGDAKTYDEIVTDEVLAEAREALGFDASPERVAELAESIAEQRASFET